MTEGVPRDVVDGLVLTLSTGSFAARAVLGSVLAALLAAAAVRLGWLRSSRARRGLVLAPIATAAVAAIASIGDAFLPSLEIPMTGSGADFSFAGADYQLRDLEWLLIAYVVVVTLLLVRRAASHLAIRAYLRRAEDCTDPTVLAVVRRLASKMRLDSPQVLLAQGCPGGAFTTGLRRPIICLDRDLIATLDDRELEGLLAHELAHIARRDVTVNVGLGVFRDLTFFVAPLHVAARWIRQEQEHAADDLASESTGRPAALASSILKVWEGASVRGGAALSAMACATMVPQALPVPAGMPARILRQGGLRGGAKLIATRVVRLIDGQHRASSSRERAELALLTVTIAALTAVTVALPLQLGSQVMVGGWTVPAPPVVESPAMATFRALAPVQSTTAFGIASTPAVASHTCTDCLGGESSSDWRSARTPVRPARTGGWDGERYPWTDPTPVLVRTPTAEPLLGVDSRSGWVGVAVVR